MINLLHYTWCLPQMLAAWVLRLFVKVYAKERISNVVYYKCNLNGSISLGNKVFLGKGHWGDVWVKSHEHGHYQQNLMLGPLYLFVIGIPSFIWAQFFNAYRAKKNVSYYAFYTEKWANKLEGLI